MGAVYDVNMEIKYNSKKKIIKATKDFMKNRKYARFEHYGDHRTLVGYIKDIITDREFDISYNDDGYEFYESHFDASYGWESVMVDWFKSIAAFLDDNSYIKIFTDSGRRYLYVKNGEAMED